MQADQSQLLRLLTALFALRPNKERAGSPPPARLLGEWRVKLKAYLCEALTHAPHYKLTTITKNEQVLSILQRGPFGQREEQHLHQLNREGNEPLHELLQDLAMQASALMNTTCGGQVNWGVRPADGAEVGMYPPFTKVEDLKSMIQATFAISLWPQPELNQDYQVKVSRASDGRSRVTIDFRPRAGITCVGQPVFFRVDDLDQEHLNHQEWLKRIQEDGEDEEAEDNMAESPYQQREGRLSTVKIEPPEEQTFFPPQASIKKEEEPDQSPALGRDKSLLAAAIDLLREGPLITQHIRSRLHRQGFKFTKAELNQTLYKSGRFKQLKTNGDTLWSLT